MREICSKYRVKQVSDICYTANFIEKTDEFIIFPIGFGKSLIYQALPLVCDTVRGTTGQIVVSPLANLMEDHATKLANIGIPAVTLSDIIHENMRVVERGAFSVVYESLEAWLKIDRCRKC